MPPRNVVLIGFMGAGKSEIGRALAARLSYKFVDTDSLVEGAAARSIDEIFATDGEEGFRALEAEAVVRACAGNRRVISCGGGAVLQLRNYGILKGAGRIVYLRAPAGVLRERVGAGTGRPLLADRAFERLLAERVPAYEAAADLIVDSDAGSPDEIAAEIEHRLG
jgi:shikimate kinase